MKNKTNSDRKLTKTMKRAGKSSRGGRSETVEIHSYVCLSKCTFLLWAAGAAYNEKQAQIIDQTLENKPNNK